MTFCSSKVCFSALSVESGVNSTIDSNISRQSVNIYIQSTYIYSVSSYLHLVPSYLYPVNSVLNV